MSHDGYVPGDWNASCYVCGRIFKASEMRKHWRGYYTCEKDWEPRHPQDFIKAVPDGKAPEWTQPEPERLRAAFCTPNGISARPDFALPDCMIPNFVSPLFDATIIDL